MNSYEETYEPIENYDNALGKVIITGIITGILFLVLLSGIGSASPTINIFANDNLGINNGTIIQNVTYNPEGSYNFSTGYIDLNNPFYLNSSSNYTVSLWVLSNTDAGTPTFLSYRSTSSSTPILFQLDRSSTVNIRALVRNDSNTAVTLTASGVSSNNTWIHVALTKIGNNHTLYINGTSFASTNSVGSATVNKMIMGGGVAGSPTVQASSLWKGDIDELRIYNLGLNTSDISQIYNQGRTISNISLLNESLINYYDFNDLGNILINGTGNLNISYINSSIIDKFKVNLSSSNILDLRVPVTVQGSINFSLVDETIRLFSNENYFAYLNILLGDSLLNRTSIYSWNNNTNTIDNSYINSTRTLRGRAYVKITHGVCEIWNSNFTGLGYLDGLTSTSKKLEGFILDTCNNGNVKNNLFTFNHFLFSDYNSNGLKFENNTGYNTTGGNNSIAVTGFGFYSSINTRVIKNNVSNIISLTGWKSDDSQAMSFKGIGVNNSFENNTVYNSEAGIVIFNQHDNSSILNNNIFDIRGSAIKVEDGGNTVRTVRNIVVANNSIINAGKSTGSSSSPRYGVELDFIEGAINNSNIIVEQNNISDSYNCVNTRYGQDIIIRNNNCFNVSDTSFNTLLNGAITIQNTTNISISNNFIGETYNLTELTLLNSNVSSYNTFSELETFNNGVLSIFQFNYNLTNSLIYFSNGSVACSTISTCDGNINITLTPNNYGYVLDNFNLTEGVTRQFSPLSISGSSTSKTITSQLSQGINATVVVDVPKCNFNQITYDGNPISPSNCLDNQATFNLNDIPSGASLLIINYAGGTPSLNECDASEGLLIGITSIGQIGNIAPVLVAVTVIVYLIFGYKVFRRSGNPKLEKVENLWNAFIGLLMFAMLGVAIALVMLSNIPC